MDWTHFPSTFVSAMGKIIRWLKIFKPQDLLILRSVHTFCYLEKLGTPKSDFYQIYLAFTENLSTGVITITMKVSKVFI